MEGKKLKEKQLKKEQEERNKTQAKKVNHTSEKYIIQKFNREFNQLIAEMFTELRQENQEEEHKDEEDLRYKNIKINYLRLKELLLALGMVNENSTNTDSNEGVLLYELWKLLKGEEREEISLDDVKMVIQAILRMNDHKRIGI